MKCQTNLKKHIVWVLITTAILLLPLLLWNSSMQAKSLRQQDRQAGAGQELTPVVIEAVKFAESAPFRSDILPGLNLVANPVVNFDGIDMDSLAPILGVRFSPPDPNVDVGPNHVVMAINTAFQVFNKSGTPLTPVTRLSNLFAPLGSPFDNPGAGDERDPCVLYDPLADRWIISQWEIAEGESYQVVGISQTPDPTRQYYTYAFPMPSGRLTADPRWGVWPDGYYLSTNDFGSTGTPFLGAGLYAFERVKMLAGDSTAKVIRFNTAPANGGGFLPADIDGVATPAAGTPNLFIRYEADEFGAPTDVLRVIEFRPNFTNPSASTLIQLPDIPVAAFDARKPPGRAVIDQPPPATAADSLDAIADRLMQRLAYRTLANGTQSYALNFTVNVSGENPTSAAAYQGGVRWMELRRNATTGAVTINQQATYAPGAGDGATGRNLWMAAIAQDGEGNIGLAANASSTTLNPTAIYTGRLAGDPANTLPQGEVDALAAVPKGVQLGTGNRWGAYSSLSVDPADDCTFWGAFEYVDAPTASFDWNTRVFNFKVNPSCVSAAKSTIRGSIPNCGANASIPNAVITTPEGYFRQTDAIGNYSMTVAPGTYTLTVTTPGFSPVTGMVTVGPNQTATFSPCLRINCSAITVNPASLPAGTVGAAYSQTVTASGGSAPHTFSLSAGRLPNGLRLSSGGVLAGTPAQAGSFSFTIKATDVNGCMGEQDYRLVIAARSAGEVCLQDDRNGNVLRINILTGNYKFCGRDGVTFEGSGEITRRGNIVRLQDGNRVSASLVFLFSRLLAGRAEVQPAPLGTTYFITDRNPNNNQCACP